jgi:hypothetical protein
MPCYDPSPSNRDFKTVEVAKLIIFFNEKVNIATHPKILKLSKNESGYGAIGAGEYLDELTKYLCSQLNLLNLDQIFLSVLSVLTLHQLQISQPSKLVILSLAQQYYQALEECQIF